MPYIQLMSETLSKMVKKKLLEFGGNNSTARLAVLADVSPSLIERVKAGHVPLPKNAKKLALACGSSEEEALRIADGCSSLAKAS